ncbi:glycosyltransferase family 9 protein [Chromobacterium subtsugae]|uniref:Glycosyltransferase family 9 protein n=1 Tax=Chromobacterium subtsugae TaxID=251747 RepID=A0ABS7FFW4_9NEIS|nr:MULTISPECIES: glycosyltransferase family 9 protein [Chromobacterium]KUM03988.1 hypothetical protein Cv017_16885 [Chromobacterium subtsugae]KZE86448.1 hypothetical protein AWB61_15720 [Chromobacterium sp. F49]MBW7567716.1 glycosyltransferase family 9 protein [Chromobacterium subtsugae]MBW8288942.1 glycosyltransferase family 9 protein [Chromobacterium subtsugae]WSE91265.1 glycosyltransferase family 9 protein [Chromobacterium subtsugae]
MKLQTLKFLDKLLSTTIAWLPRRRKPSTQAPRRILLIKLSAMGDAFCLHPVARRLAAAFPAASIDWLTTGRSNPGLFRNLPFLHDTLIVPTQVRALLAWLPRLLFAIRKYDIVMDFDQYYHLSELLSRCGKTSAGFSTALKGKTFSLSIPYDPQLNEKVLFHKLAERVMEHYGVTHAPPRDFYLPELLDAFTPSLPLQQLAAEIKTHQLPVVVLYAGSSANAAFRRLDIDKYLAIIEQTRNRHTFVIAGGPDELALKTHFQLQHPNVYELIGSLNLLEWAWLFRHVADLLLGNDGGLLHVAESQSTPMLAIFGPSLFRKWGSINPESRGIETDLPCRPCLKNYLGIVPTRCQFSTVKCLDAIEVATIIANMESMLEKKQRQHMLISP